MKRVLLSILALVVLAVAGALFFLTRMDAGFIVTRIAEATERATGAPLELEAAPHLSFLPPGVRFGAARWSGSVDGCAVTVTLKGGVARLEPGPLLSGQIVLSELRLDRPDADIRLPAPKAPAKATTGPAPVPAANKGDAAPARKAPDDALPVELGRLTVSQGALHLADAARDIRISGFNLSLEHLRRREEADIQGDMVLELRQADAPDNATAPAKGAPLLEGNFAFKGALRYYAPNLTFRQVSLAFTPLGGVVPRELAPLQLTGEGALDLAHLTLRLAEARLTAPQARLTLQGEGGLAPLAFAGRAELTGSLRKLAALGGLAPASGMDDSLALRCRVEARGSTLRLAGLDGTAGGTSLGGELALGLPTGAQKAPSLGGNVRLGALDLAAWLPGPGAGPAPGAAAQAPGKETGAVKEGGATAARALLGLDLSLGVAALRYGGFGLTDISARISGAAGRYSLGDVSARLAGGGALTGSLGADMARAAYTLVVNASGVDIGALCAAAGKAGVASGSADFSARLGAQGADSAALVASLEGEGLLEARDLAAPALRDAATALNGLAPGLNLPERIASLRAPFTARRGEVTARPVTATAPGISARGEARLGLARQTVEGTATLAALGLDIPLDFKGPWDAVQVSVDPGFALELARKLGGLRGLPGAAGKAVPGAPGNAIREGMGAAGGLMRGLFGH